MDHLDLRPESARPSRCAALLVLALGALLAPGCAAITNPLVDSIPVRHAPPELLQTCIRDHLDSIPLTFLQPPPVDVYRLDSGDVLGVWIDGIIGDLRVPIPVHILTNPALREQRTLPPSAGYPFTVREDGTVLLPMLKQPLQVRGLTLSEAENVVKQAILRDQLLPKGTEKMFVTLLQKRQVEIVVLRQEATAFGVGAEGAFTTAGKRGTGFVINLSASENDVLHALSLTGGLPGLDAYNQVVIYRRLAPHGIDRQMLLKRLEQLPPGSPLPAELVGNVPMVRIPLRLVPGQPMPFQPQDVILQTGDVVFLEARDKDVYWTAGLLPAGEHVLPRDRDLDVLAAVALVRGPMVNSTYGSNTLSGLVFPPGLGQPSASLLVVLRRTADGGQVPLRVDLNRALRDSRERIVVHAGDLLILQERPTEALARYMGQTLTNFNLLWSPIHGRHEIGTFDFMAPDRLPGRGQYATFVPGQ
jgi:protein involved in polysaccharide export with SLBB domain